MKWKIPLFKSYWEEDDIEAVAAVIRRGTYWATGPEIEQFEKEIAEYIGRDYCVSFNSGTSALHAMLLAYGITSREVIVPTFTFIATANTVLLAGGRPVFAESEPHSFGLDANDVKNKITKKTKAIMPMSFGGLVCKDMKALQDLCEDHHLLLLEDSAQSLGSSLENQLLGTFGEAAMFSFCQNKVITTGEGGVIVTDSQKIAEKLKLIRSHGRVETTLQDYFSTTKDMDYIQLGYNYRMPSMIAALGCSQLQKIEKTIAMRQQNAYYYTKNLSGLPKVMPPSPHTNQRHVYQMYTIKFDDTRSRNAVQNSLTKHGIMSKVYFEPIHLKTYYRKTFGYKSGDLPQTEDLSKHVLTLPMYPNLKKEEIDKIVHCIQVPLGENANGNS